MGHLQSVGLVLVALVLASGATIAQGVVQGGGTDGPSTASPSWPQGEPFPTFRGDLVDTATWSHAQPTAGGLRRSQPPVTGIPTVDRQPLPPHVDANGLWGGGVPAASSSTVPGGSATWSEAQPTAGGLRRSQPPVTDIPTADRQPLPPHFDGNSLWGGGVLAATTPTFRGDLVDTATWTEAQPAGTAPRRIGPVDQITGVGLPRGTLLVFASAEGTPITAGGGLDAAAAVLALVPIGTDGKVTLDFAQLRRGVNRLPHLGEADMITIQILFVPADVSTGPPLIVDPIRVSRGAYLS